MYDDIGGKIKIVAMVMCWIGIIASVIAAIICFAVGFATGEEYLVGYGFGLLIGGPLASWIGSFFAYGFGELIDNSQELLYQYSSSASNASNLYNVNDVKNNEHSDTASNIVGSDPYASALPVEQQARKLTTSNSDKIVCSLCGFEQPSNRTCCWKCSAKFDESNRSMEEIAVKNGPTIKKDIRREDGFIWCPNCNTRQNGARLFCYKCGQYFVEEEKQ